MSAPTQAPKVLNVAVVGCGEVAQCVHVSPIRSSRVSQPARTANNIIPYATLTPAAQSLDRPRAVQSDGAMRYVGAVARAVLEALSRAECVYQRVSCASTFTAV